MFIMFDMHVHVCMCANMHACMHVCVCACACMHVCVHGASHTSTPTHTHPTPIRPPTTSG